MNRREILQSLGVLPGGMKLSPCTLRRFKKRKAPGFSGG